MKCVSVAVYAYRTLEKGLEHFNVYPNMVFMVVSYNFCTMLEHHCFGCTKNKHNAKVDGFLLWSKQ